MREAFALAQGEDHAAALAIVVPTDPARRPVIVGTAPADTLLAAAAALLYGAFLSPDLSDIAPSDPHSDAAQQVAFARRAIERVTGKLR